MAYLLEAFIEEESDYARQLVLDAVRVQKTNPVRVRDTFDFNVFSVEILYEERIVVLEHDFDCSPAGTLRIGLDAFVSRLRETV